MWKQKDVTRRNFLGTSSAALVAAAAVGRDQQDDKKVPRSPDHHLVKVVQRLPVRIRLNDGEDREHLLRVGMSVEPKVWLR